MKKASIILLTLFLISCSSMKKEQIDTLLGNDSVCIIKNDTIALISSINDKELSADINTKRIYKECDIDTINIIVKNFADKIKEDYTVFFYSNNRLNNNDWYGSYYKGRFGLKIKNEVENKPPKEHIEDIIEMMRSDIEQDGIGFVRVFLAKKDMFSESVKKYGDEVLKKEFSKYLIRNFPKARKNYYEYIKVELWEKDIVVKMRGRDIKFYGYMFASNKVIKDTYNGISHELEKLRFNKCYFGWIEDEDEHVYIVSDLKDNNI